MTLRGFKDRDKGYLATYAGTAARLSRRIVTSEAAVCGWPMVALDVRKAFLKGVTYDELAKTTGEPRRDVNFELTADAAEILRQIPGYEGFDENVEVLHCDKPVQDASMPLAASRSNARRRRMAYSAASRPHLLL